VGSGGVDPFAEFLPTFDASGRDVRLDPEPLRAVVIITEGSEKRGQRYLDPLMVLSGEEYLAISFEELRARIAALLERRAEGFVDVPRRPVPEEKATTRRRRRER
jgi:hypothetical protein